MRKLKVLEHISLDGVIQAPGGKDEDPSDGFFYGGWSAPFSDPVLSEALWKQMNHPFDLLLGRKTYQMWEPYWPNHTDIWPNADKAIKYVVSNTLTTADWKPSAIISGVVVKKISELKQQDGPEIHCWGSSGLLQTLLKHNLVDSLWLMIYPVVLGHGKRLFGSGTMPAAFNVVDGLVTPSGCIYMHYERAGNVQTGNL